MDKSYWNDKEDRWINFDADWLFDEKDLGFDQYDIPMDCFDWSAKAWLDIRSGKQMARDMCIRTD